MNEIGPFNKSEFLSEGAVFGDSEAIYFMWGPGQLSRQQPVSNWAVCHWDFFEGHLGWQSYSNHLKVSRNQAEQLFSRDNLIVDWNEIDRENFDKQFELVKKWFAENSLSKVVPYCFEQGCLDMNASNRESVLSSLLTNDHGFIYGQWNKDSGIVGLTPETLIEQTSKGSFKTMAVAGTTSKEAFQENPDAFLKNQKEINEHEKVVTSLKEKLRAFGQVDSLPREVLETPHLVHLYTEMALHSEDSIERLAKALHPTPALGCYPDEHWVECMGAFNKIEPREGFGAPFGFSQGENNAHFVVAIRNMTWNQDQIKIGSGCGVVEQSHPDSEWNELFLKRDSVKRILGLS